MIRFVALSFIVITFFGCGSGDSSNAGPSGATAKCADGTFSSSQSCSGTCSGHGGVAAWYGILSSCGK